MSKSSEKRESAQSKAKSESFRYLCPACTNDAIVSSNKMIGVEVDCQHCGKRIKLDDPQRYLKI